MNKGSAFALLRVAFYIWVIAYFEVPWFMVIVLIFIMMDALSALGLYILGCAPVWIDLKTRAPILPQVIRKG